MNSSAQRIRRGSRRPPCLSDAHDPKRFAEGAVLRAQLMLRSAVTHLLTRRNPVRALPQPRRAVVPTPEEEGLSEPLCLQPSN
jgi:hypothetical protein